jgi:hypothetical protein
MAKYEELPVIHKLNGKEINPLEFAKLYSEKVNKQRREELNKDGRECNQTEGRILPAEIPG